MSMKIKKDRLGFTQLLAVKDITVKSHNGHVGNEKADELANKGLKELLCDKTADTEKIKVYVKGYYPGNRGCGGWGAVIEFEDTNDAEELLLSNGDLKTTQYKMELTATIKALEALKEPGQTVVIISDSKSLKNVNNINRWRKNGWRLLGRKMPVMNKDLWQDLEIVAARHIIEWRWVEDKSGNKGLSLAKKLACNSRKEIFPRK